jgi:hypothetical protein
LTDVAAWERMAAEGRRDAETRFNTALVIPQYEEIYRRVLGVQ